MADADAATGRGGGRPPTRPVTGAAAGAGSGTVRTAAGRRATLAAGVTGVAGLWLLVALPLAGRLDAVAAVVVWNDAVAGVLLIAVAVAGRVARPGLRVGSARGVALVGCWLVLAPAVLRYDTGPGFLITTWNDALVGVALLFAAGLWSRSADR